MKSTGLIVEYNPFHNGHLHHVEQARQLTNADVIIAVMSGNFLQRGEPAIVSKWARAKMALSAGVDLVVELPYVFAVQHAKKFAFGSINILKALDCDNFCFGSESGDIDEFYQALNFIKVNQVTYEENVKKLMKTGISFPSALTNSFTMINHQGEFVDLTKPNNILGFHYIEANHELITPMKAYTIKRKNANYHDKEFSSSTIASATSIRKATFEGNQSLQKIEQYIPDSTLKAMEEYLSEYGSFHHWEQYWPFLQYRLLNISSEDLEKIYDIEEGLEHRLQKMAKESQSFQEFMNKIKTKRYTWTRLQRICVHILTNTKKNEMKKLHDEIQYIRLLGMTHKGREYLNHKKKDLPFPIISKLSSYPNKIVQLDVRAANIYAQGLQEPYRSSLFKMEYAQPPYYFK